MSAREPQTTPRKGLFHTLTQEQQTRVKTYDGPENIGSADEMRVATERLWEEARKVTEGRKPRFGFRPVK